MTLRNFAIRDGMVLHTIPRGQPTAQQLAQTAVVAEEEEVESAVVAEAPQCNINPRN